MTTTLPSVEITATTPGDYPFGLFSVAPTSSPAGDYWTAGVWWRSIAGQQVGITYGPCDVDAPSPVDPLSVNVSCSIGEASAFTVYAHSDESVAGDALPAKFARARAILQAGEQYAVETALWYLLMADTAAADGTTTSVVEALAMAEGLIARAYAGPATMHASRYTATMLGHDVLRADGTRLRTVLGATVIAGGGYDPAPTTTDPALSIIATGAPLIMRGELNDLGQTIDRATNSISAVVERTYVVGWDGPAVRVAVS